MYVPTIRMHLGEFTALDQRNTPRIWLGLYGITSRSWEENGGERSANVITFQGTSPKWRMFIRFSLACNSGCCAAFTCLVCFREGQWAQVLLGAMQINHFIMREIIYDVLWGLQIQSSPCSHCHVPCLGLSSVFIRGLLHSCHPYLQSDDLSCK